MADARQKVIELEKKVLQYSGLELDKELFVYDVQIELNGRQHLIHTYRCGNKDGDVLVMIHGYGGSSALYYKMLKTLGEKFLVYCIDIIGMGLSSKESFECQTTEETIEFLTGSVEKWREAVGLDKFNLTGHSFGGYISTHYTLRYKDRVKKLNLLSPVGVTKQPQELTPEELEKKEQERINQMGFFKRHMWGWVRNYAKKAWENKLTPVQFMRDHSFIGSIIVKQYVYKRFKLPDNEAGALYEYLYAMLSLPEGCEKAIHYILKPPRMSAHIPLEDYIVDITVPIDCYYGDADYMNMEGSTRVHQSGKKKDFVLKTVPSAQHQVTIQNPLDLANQMVVSALV